jgi:NAD(P)-dependent dehydrogenase (short-subunit alcohol dehydrogenase family)
MIASLRDCHLPLHLHLPLSLHRTGVTMSLYAMLKPDGPSGFGYGSTAEDVTAGLSLAGKTILVTGCNSGLGAETARVLALRGARVFGTARTTEKANAALQACVGAQGFACELAEPSSVRAAVAAITAALGTAKLDAIICNAGIMALPKNEVAHGLELQFLTNHIGHFILVTGLLDALADDGRVVMLSSAAHAMAPTGGIEFDNLSGARGYSPWKQYGQSKMANLLFAKELARRFAGTKRTANAVHPGVIQTNLGRHMNPVANFVFGLANPLVLKDVHQGAATSCYVAVHPDTGSISGRYFADCNVATERKDGSDLETAKKLWTVSEELVARL